MLLPSCDHSVQMKDNLEWACLNFQGGVQARKAKESVKKPFFFVIVCFRGGTFATFALFSLLYIDVWTRQQYKQAMCDSEQLHGKGLLVLATACVSMFKGVVVAVC